MDIAFLLLVSLRFWLFCLWQDGPRELLHRGQSFCVVDVLSVRPSLSETGIKIERFRDITRPDMKLPRHPFEMYYDSGQVDCPFRANVFP